MAKETPPAPPATTTGENLYAVSSYASLNGIGARGARLGEHSGWAVIAQPVDGMRRVDARDELELVRSAFEQLSEKQLRLLIGRVIWKEGAKTIAAAESPPVTPGEVYVSVHAALRKLRHAMNEAKGNPITPTVRRKRPARKTNANPDLLTTSEIDICELIEAGATHKKAAIQLGIPIGAVRYRMLAARRRIGAHSTLELIDHFRKQRAIEQSLSSQEG